MSKTVEIISVKILQMYSKIENELKEADQATIEGVISKIIFIENDISVNFLHIGKVPGKSKTRKRTPDIYYKLPNNLHIFRKLFFTKS